MTRWYLRWLTEDGKPDPQMDPMGPYPNPTMAERMRQTYEALLKRKSEVIEYND